MADTTIQSGDHGGLSRRALIKRAAAAGALAWTAPVIVDSLSNAAFATMPSPCVLYWAKLLPTGGCYSACPSGGYTVTPQKRWACTGNPPDACSDPDNVGYSTKQPSVSAPDANGYRKITLQSGCFFYVSGGITTSNWAVVGNYEFHDFNALPSGSGSPPVSGPGHFVNNGSSAWIKSTAADGDNLSYIYVQFCCSS
ncbi:MAG: hypothetical protein AMXMBFR46_05740 [Acidimicrobiia bacterium]